MFQSTEGAEPHRGRQGASRQAWTKINVRTIIYDLRQENPKASRERLLRLLDERLTPDDDARMSAMDWMLSLCEGAWAGNKRRAEPEQRTVRREAAEIEIQKKLQSYRQQFEYLNMIMPNDKRMRHCSREEMAKFHGGFGRMVKKMKPGELVGAAFSEGQVRELMS